MGMRKYYREMAKARLKASGLEVVGMGLHMPNSQNRKFQRTRKGCQVLEKIHNEKMAPWRNVLWGPQAKNAEAVLMNEGKKLQKARALRMQ